MVFITSENQLLAGADCGARMCSLSLSLSHTHFQNFPQSSFGGFYRPSALFSPLSKQGRLARASFALFPHLITYFTRSRPTR